MVPSRRTILINVLVLFPLILLALGPASAAHEVGTITSEYYGTTFGGEDVYEYTLTNAGKKPMEVKIITYGGIITSIVVPDKGGNLGNVALGFDNLQDYETKNPYFGCITGRYANRIALGKFTIDGLSYCLDINNDPNSLHGGFVGFDKKVWEVTGAEVGPNGPLLELHYLSLAGEGFEGSACPDGTSTPGYPGNMDIYVTYTLTDDNELIMEYRATTDAPTVINLTNHTIGTYSRSPSCLQRSACKVTARSKPPLKG